MSHRLRQESVELVGVVAELQQCKGELWVTVFVAALGSALSRASLGTTVRPWGNPE